MVTTSKSSVREAAEEQMSSLSSAVHASYSKAQETIRSQPESAVLVGLAAGLGVGVVIGFLISRPAQPAYGWFDRRNAERVGQRIMDAISSVMPESISDRLG